MRNLTDNSIDPTEFLEGTFWEASNQNFITRRLYDNFFNCIEIIVNSIPVLKNSLEVGCGVGFSSLRIKDMLPDSNFEISDVNEAFVKNMQAKGFPIKVIQESVLSLDREDKSIDCIFLLEVLEHVEDFEKALSELFRVSRAYIIISVPNEPLWRILNILRGKYIKLQGNTPGHINHWSPNSFTKLINKYGIVKKVFLPFPWIIVFAQVNNDTEQNFANK
jgi:2-polyprenyl-3-methyl-5-hydroxy-6-metoxy-1,4-benzoquinol methylase